MPKLSELTIADLKATLDRLEYNVTSLEEQIELDPRDDIKEILNNYRKILYKISRHLDDRIDQLILN